MDLLSEAGDLNNEICQVLLFVSIGKPFINHLSESLFNCPVKDTFLCSEMELPEMIVRLFKVYQGPPKNLILKSTSK